MVVFTQIVRFLALLMVAVVSVAVIVGIVITGGTMIWEFIKDKIKMRR